jgi:hypothetical protein
METPYIYIYFLSNRRDTHPESSTGYMQDLISKIIEIGISKPITVVRHYYTIDYNKQ